VTTAGGTERERNTGNPSRAGTGCHGEQLGARLLDRRRDCHDRLHEVIGHGGACLLAGGQPLSLSTVHMDCDRGGRLVAAGGTLVNFAVGLLCLPLLGLVSRNTRLRYFLWLLMTVNLLAGSGYFLFSGTANIGDWAVVIGGLQPAWLWRAGLTLLGAGTYLACVWLALLELRPFLPHLPAARVRQAKRLAVTPYLAGGIVSCVAGLLNPVGMILVAISAAASSFGGTSGLAWMWQLTRRKSLRACEVEMPALRRSRGWLVAAGIVALLFIGVLGPGLRLAGG
jgi:hypothetical protein